MSGLRQRVAVGVVVFFFQAEDGIRDTSVTGVQTCALPISMSWSWASARSSSTSPTRTASPRRRRSSPLMPPPIRDRAGSSAAAGTRRAGIRSEERRVGKEGRYGCSRDHEKKKQRTKAEQDG